MERRLPVEPLSKAEKQEFRSEVKNSYEEVAMDESKMEKGRGESEPTLDDLEGPNCVDQGFLHRLRRMFEENPSVFVCTSAVGTVLGLGIGRSEVAVAAVDIMSNEAAREVIAHDIEARLFEMKKIQALEKMHAEAGEGIRKNETLALEFSPEEVEMAAQAFEEFDMQGMLRITNRESGVSTWELARGMQTAGIVVYSDRMLGNATQADYEGKSKELLMRVGGLNAHLGGEITKVTMSLNGEKTTLGIYDAREQKIYINLSDIHQGAENPEHFKSRILDVLYHENAHSWQSMQYEKGSVKNVMREGMTETLSNIFMHELYAGDPNPYMGYSDGGTAGATFVYEGLTEDGKRAYWKSYVEGDDDLLSRAYDEQYGENAFANLVAAPIESNGDECAKVVLTNLAVLDRAVAHAGAHAEEIASKVNESLGKSQMTIFRSDWGTGIILSSKERDVTYGGILHLQNGERKIDVAIRPSLQHELKRIDGANAAMWGTPNVLLGLLDHEDELKKLVE